jgi:type IV secretion system protein TrbI
MPDPNPNSNAFPDPQQPGGEVRDRSLRPAGLLPKNTQTYVILAIAVIMIGAIAFSGGNSSKPASNGQPKTAAVIDPNLARIQDYRNRIDEEAQKLAAEQAQLEKTKQALGLPPASPGVPAPGGVASIRPAVVAPTYPPPPARTEKSTLESEKEKREYQSLFASNIALTYRKDGAGTAEMTNGVEPPQTPALPRSSATAALTAPPAPLPYGWPYAPPSVLAPAPAPTVSASSPTPAASANSPSKGEPTGAESAESASFDSDHEPEARSLKREHIDPSLQKADGKAYRLFEGTIVETVLTNRLEGSFDGPVNCLVTTDVYSHDDQHLLIPKGTRVLGEVKRNDAFGQQRLAVAFHRLIMPDGYSVSLDQFKGLSQIGETGLRDQVNHHYLQIFGVSLAIGAIAGLSNVNTTYGVSESGLDAYRQGVSASLSQSSMRILDKYLNVLPTFTIREGQRIKVVLSDDLMLPAYDRHKIPSDF